MNTVRTFAYIYKDPLTMIENRIKENIENPEQLEKLYRADKKIFERAFFDIYPEISGFKLAEFWNVRLGFDSPQENKLKVSRIDILFLIVTCAITGFLIKIPQIFGISLEDYLFYEKNAGLIVFMGLSAYSFLTKNSFKNRHLIISIGVFIISAIYINLLPSNRDSHSIDLAYIHLPLLLWCVYGLIYINFDTKDKTKRIDYIKYNGDLAILSAIILIAGMILAGVTNGLFSAIGIEIEQFYMDYIAIWGIVSVPIVATYIIRNYPLVTNKIAPIIANIFSPLVLLTLIIYLVSIPLVGKDPYNDRDFLLIFNLMLLGVMGIIVFSISETSINKKQKINEMTLFMLTIVTLIIDLVALSAILYRLGEYGFTPNRTAVLGSNLLIFGNLILIMIDLFRVNFRSAEIKQVELTISKYLPIYMIWTIFVVIGFPLIFGLK